MGHGLGPLSYTGCFLPHFWQLGFTFRCCLADFGKTGYQAGGRKGDPVTLWNSIYHQSPQTLEHEQSFFGCTSWTPKPIPFLGPVIPSPLVSDRNTFGVAPRSAFGPQIFCNVESPKPQIFDLIDSVKTLVCSFKAQHVYIHIYILYIIYVHTSQYLLMHNQIQLLMKSNDMKTPLKCPVANAYIYI